MDDKLKHEDIAAIAELLGMPQWQTVKKIADNYIWAIRKTGDSWPSEKDMFFHQGEIAGIKALISRLELVAKKTKRKEAKDV